jgi:fructokinase
VTRALYGAIEAGGTKFICAAGYGPTEIIDSLRAEIPTSTPAATLSAVAAFFGRVRREAGALAGIGIAAFGPVDLDQRSRSWGRLLATPKPGWSGVSLTEPLEPLGCPIAIDTDVNAAALAEARVAGAHLGVRSLAYVTVGTGIGGGVIIDGRSIRGLLHPEMGHLLVRRDPRDVDFGGICPFHCDCLEGLASGPAIMARWNAPVASWPDSHPGLEIIGGYLGQLAATIALVLSCERIVFGGGVMSSGRLLPFIRGAAARQLNGYLPIEARAGGFERYISPAALGKLAGLTGALLLAGAPRPA